MKVVWKYLYEIYYTSLTNEDSGKTWMFRKGFEMENTNVFEK